MMYPAASLTRPASTPAITGVVYEGGSSELMRFLTDLRALIRDLIEDNDSYWSSSLSDPEIVDQILTKASRTRNGADAYFTAK